MNDLDPEVLAVLQQVAPDNVRPFSELSVDEARAQARSIAGNVARLSRSTTFPEVDRVEEVEASGVRGRRYVPSSNPTGTILYFPGGGWMLGSIDEYDGVARILGARSNYSIVLVDYRKAPEHPFPAAVDDCWTILKWAGECEETGPIVVAGDSAGGNLAAVTALRSRDEGGPSIAMQVLIHPATDSACATKSFERWQDGPVVTKTDLQWFWAHYLGGRPADGSSPLASPLRASSFAGLPPAITILAECDPVHDDGLAYAQQLEESGVSSFVHEVAAVPHTFVSLAGLLPAADAALELVADRIAGLDTGEPTS